MRLQPQGTLKLEGDGMVWRKSGGGKTVQMPAKDIESIEWAKSGKDTVHLLVKQAGGGQNAFVGLRQRDLQEITGHLSGVELKEKHFDVTGRNWGELGLSDSQMTFEVNDKTAFEVPITDVSQASLQGKNEVALEFQVDDTGAATREDALVEMSFYVPPNSSTFVGNDEQTAAKVFLEQVLKKADLETSSDDMILSMPDMAVVVPRGRYEVEMHMTFLKLVGQSQDFRISYSSIMRIFILPKVHQPQTLVVLSLDPPIRKGQTLYPHVLFQFHNDDVEEVSLNITDEALAKKSEQAGVKLERSFQGPTFDVFSKVVRGLAGVKISRPHKYKNSSADGHCVRCSYKSDDGYLFPLERAFFYVQKPPLLILFDEVESVEFQRQALNQYSGSSRTFDLVVRTKTDAEYLFRSIQKQEWQNLFTFIQERNLKIDNLKQVQQSMRGEGQKVSMQDLAGDDDDSDEEDEDFMADDDDSEEEADSDDDDDDDEEEADSDDDDDDDDSDDDGSDSDEKPTKKKKKKN